MFIPRRSLLAFNASGMFSQQQIGSEASPRSATTYPDQLARMIIEN